MGFAEDQFLFIHIPKTAGTTFSLSFLSAIYPPERRFLISGSAGRWEADRDQLLAMTPEERDRLGVITGHAVMPLKEHLPRARTITILRDPIERYLSAYFHFLNWTLQDEEERVAWRKEWPLERYVQVNPNPQARLLLPGVPADRLDPQEALDRVDLVGLTERFDLFLYYLHHAEGFPLLLLVSRLVHGAKQGMAPSPSATAACRESNQVDYVLYDLARQRQEAALKAIWSPQVQAGWYRYRDLMDQFRREHSEQSRACQLLAPGAGAAR